MFKLALRKNFCQRVVNIILFQFQYFCWIINYLIKNITGLLKAIKFCNLLGWELRPFCTWSQFLSSFVASSFFSQRSTSHRIRLVYNLMIFRNNSLEQDLLIALLSFFFVASSFIIKGAHRTG